jgi:hypothetical protein
MAGVFRSTDGGATFTPFTAPPQAACLGDRGDALFSCGANWDPDLFSLGRSPDGAAWTKVFRFVEMIGPLQCPAGTPPHEPCAAREGPALLEMFGITPPGPAGGDAPGGHGGGDGCCDGGGAAAPVLVVGGLAAALLLRRRRKRPCCE